ncbi:MAG TPA: rhodanese-like domain-containing protein [Candidatus Angelobacter sp.]|nr:rhodanese-like domain-containing protein [Candidatus Angelobacter sp.]
MSRKSLIVRIVVGAILVTLALPAFGQSTANPAEKDLRPGSPVLIHPQELATLLKSPKGRKPLVFYIGPEIFYQQAHIPGAEFLGPDSMPQGVEKLHKRAAALSRATFIVIYCGCCPWSHCPNIHPAYNELKKMGFSKVRVLFLETSFGTNWADRGFPVEKGS